MWLISVYKVPYLQIKSGEVMQDMNESNVAVALL